MSRYAIRTAIESRSPQALAEAFAACANVQEQTAAVLEMLVDCTLGEAKRIHAWADDWLSNVYHDNLRARSDARWQAMTAVYGIIHKALRDSGALRMQE